LNEIQLSRVARSNADFFQFSIDFHTGDANNSHLDIPDNNSGGVSLDIFADDYEITNLNISHPHPSDVDVSLIGP
jgi:hypothetical protein